MERGRRQFDATPGTASRQDPRRRFDSCPRRRRPPSGSVGAPLSCSGRRASRWSKPEETQAMRSPEPRTDRQASRFCHRQALPAVHRPSIASYQAVRWRALRPSAECSGSGYTDCPPHQQQSLCRGASAVNCDDHPAPESAARGRVRRAACLERAMDGLQHATVSTYKNHRCRCEACLKSGRRRTGGGRAGPGPGDSPALDTAPVRCRDP